MALTGKNRFSIIGVKSLLFTCIEGTIKTESDGLINDYWLYTP
jgi:hypothetical protein